MVNLSKYNQFESEKITQAIKREAWAQASVRERPSNAHWKGSSSAPQYITQWYLPFIYNIQLKIHWNHNGCVLYYYYYDYDFCKFIYSFYLLVCVISKWINKPTMGPAQKKNVELYSSVNADEIWFHLKSKMLRYLHFGIDRHINC